MEPMHLSIHQEKTGRHIKPLLKEKGIHRERHSGGDGVEYPQAVYKWLFGRNLLTLDNFIILRKLLNTSIEDILVIDGDIVRFRLSSFFRI